MFNASYFLDKLLSEMNELQRRDKEKREAEFILNVIKNKGQFKVFDPIEHGVYDDKYYISHTGLEVYQQITTRMLVDSLGEEKRRDIMWQIISYKTIVKPDKYLKMENDIVFKDKAEAENFCDYINSILLIKKLEKGED